MKCVIVLVVVCISISLDTGYFSNEFGLHLYDHITKNEKKNNIVFSPYSMFSVLSLLLGGCDKKSRTQLLDSLGLTSYTTQERLIHSSVFQLQNALESTEAVNVSHGVFVSEEFQLDPSFPTFSDEYYKATVIGDLVFPQDGTEKINDWVSAKTNRMIKNFLDPLSDATKCVLINTIHFENTWREKFDKGNTRSHQYALIDEEVLDGSYATHMMETPEFKDVSYGEHRWSGQEFKTIQLPFVRDQDEGSEKFGMLFALPQENSLESFTAMEKVMRENGGGELIAKIIDEQHQEIVHVKIPRFNIDWKRQLQKILKSIGIVDIFDPSKADLSKLAGSGEEDGDRNNRIFVSMILQAAKIKVDEEGCEASAASGVVIEESSEAVDPEIYSFYAHRPFMYFVYHSQSQAILFMGKVMEPEISTDPVQVWIRDYMQRRAKPFLVLAPIVGSLMCFVVLCITLICFVLVFCRTCVMKTGKEEGKMAGKEFARLENEIELIDASNNAAINNQYIFQGGGGGDHNNNTQAAADNNIVYHHNNHDDDDDDVFDPSSAVGVDGNMIMMMEPDDNEDEGEIMMGGSIAQDSPSQSFGDDEQKRALVHSSPLDTSNRW